MPLIIVEGMDNTGKTTLIQSLAEHFRLPTARTYRKPDSSTEIHQWDAWCTHCPYPLILDRHPAISDMIYGPRLRGVTYSGFGLAQRTHENNFIIYCRPPKNKIIQTINERDQLEGVAENLSDLLSDYDNTMDMLGPDFVYDYTQPRAFQTLVTVLTTHLGSL